MKSTTLTTPDPQPVSAPDRSLLAIVPARGGSKGVPFKNVRRLGDRPLIAYTVEAVVASGVADRLVVSSDYDHVLQWAEVHGHEVHERPAALADDEATISQVASHLTAELGWTGDVGVFQPTSPLRTAESIRRAVEAFRVNDVDSLASSVREPHLFWFDEEDDLTRARPLFEGRVNRQYASHRVMRETGAIQLVRSKSLLETEQMVSERHMLFELPHDESLDIDTTDDLVEARRRVEQGTVIFRVRATQKIGSGHVHHCIQLADELADQRMRFLLKDCDPFVARMLDEHGYEHRDETDLVADMEALAGPGPRLIVNDVLDTAEEDVLQQRSAGWKVVNVEDLGPGARLADWVVNALYPVDDPAHTNVVTGPRYATLRTEFSNLPPKVVRATPKRVLISFGGTDPGQLGVRCARLLVGVLDADIRVIVGPGAAEVQFPEGVEVVRKVRSMAAEMLDADLIITSAGRTVYEAAAVGTPVAVLAQGARDATHSHLEYDCGVVFLGIGPLTDDRHVVETVRRLLGDHELRTELSERLRRSIDGLGAARIAERIRAMLKGI